MNMIEVEKIELNKAIAQTKFTYIAPVISGTYTETSETAYYKRIAENEIDWPDGTKKKFKWQTIKDWKHIYKKHGLEGLYPKVRLDYGNSRVLSEQAKNRIAELIQEFPKITGVVIRERMISEGIIKKDDVSENTIQRYIKKKNLRHGGAPIQKERRTWEFPCSCDGYEADTCHTFYIFDENGEYRKTYLIAIIDNHSRLLVGAQFFFSDNSVNFQSVWKDAVIRYGKSKVLILDNGSTYKNKSTNYIAAKLGTQLIYNAPFEPVGKAIIERFFRTIKDRWLNADSGKNYHSLNELNSKLYKWIDQYNREYHQGLKEDLNDNHTPLQRYLYDMKDINPWQLANQREQDYSYWVDECFLHEETRKVNGDSTVVISGLSFDVPSQYIGMKVFIRYNPLTYQTVYLNDMANKRQISLKRTDKIENGKTRRTELIY